MFENFKLKKKIDRESVVYSLISLWILFWKMLINGDETNCARNSFYRIFFLSVRWSKDWNYVIFWNDSIILHSHSLYRLGQVKDTKFGKIGVQISHYQIFTFNALILSVNKNQCFPKKKKSYFHPFCHLIAVSNILIKIYYFIKVYSNSL